MAGDGELTSLSCATSAADGSARHVSTPSGTVRQSQERAIVPSPSEGASPSVVVAKYTPLKSIKMSALASHIDAATAEITPCS